MKEYIVKIKSVACGLLVSEELANCEIQTLERLMSLIDGILLDKLAAEARKENKSIDEYIKSKLFDISNILKGFGSRDVKELLKLIDKFVEG